jgi:putative N6-adenine-specific DNA methylase
MLPEKFDALAKTMKGLEEVLLKELVQLGATDVEIGKRNVQFKSDLKTLYKINVNARTALRVLIPISNFKAGDEKELYEKVNQFPWENYINVEQTIAIDSTVFSHTFNHSQFIKLKTKDAIVDRFSRLFRKRPSVDLEAPDVRLHVHIAEKNVSISLDSSGDSLHRRGYRKSAGFAALNEVLAAGMVMLTEWDQQSDLINPMCGSGTLAIEAHLIMNNIAPGLFRDYYGFKHWKNFDEEIWNTVLTEAKDNIIESKYGVFASDKDYSQIRKGKQNLDHQYTQGRIEIEVSDFFRSKLNSENAIVIINPPYGERMKEAEIDTFYKSIGDRLKNHYKGCTAWIISSNMDALKRVGLRTSRKIQLFNGPLECKFCKYELY